MKRVEILFAVAVLTLLMQPGAAVAEKPEVLADTPFGGGRASKATGSVKRPAPNGSSGTGHRCDEDFRLYASITLSAASAKCCFVHIQKVLAVPAGCSLTAFLHCDDLHGGFARIHCGDCGQRSAEIVAASTSPPPWDDPSADIHFGRSQRIRPGLFAQGS